MPLEEHSDQLQVGEDEVKEGKDEQGGGQQQERPPGHLFRPISILKPSSAL